MHYRLISRLLEEAKRPLTSKFKLSKRLGKPIRRALCPRIPFVSKLFLEYCVFRRHPHVHLQGHVDHGGALLHPHSHAQGAVPEPELVKTGAGAEMNQSEAEKAQMSRGV